MIGPSYTPSEAHALLLNPARCAPDDPRLGGKGRTLLLLARGGIPVPSFHCISLDAHALLVEHFRGEIEDILYDLDYGWTEAVEAAAASLQKLMRSGKLPDVLETLLSALPSLLPGEDEPRAVRSSAQIEDSARHSHAGQLESYFAASQGALRERIRDCWASAFNERLLRYQHARGLDPLKTRVAVILQRMVPSSASGVLFTADPIGQRNAVVIAAGFGLGEGVVWDRVETDRYWVDRGDWSLEREVARKTRRVVVDPGTGATTLAPVSDELEARAVLDDVQIRLLAEFGLRIESLSGAPQDVEWALDPDGNLHILQARPVVPPARGTVTLLDRSNLVEAYPGITTPLTFSFVHDVYERNFRSALRRMGAPKRALARHAHVFRGLLGYVEGHVYHVLSAWYPMLRLLPAADRIVPAWEQSVGIRERRRSDAQGSRLIAFVQMLRIARRGMLEWLRLDGSMRRLRRSLQATTDDLARMELDELSSAELADLIEGRIAPLFDAWDITILNDLLAIFFSAHSRNLLSRVSDEGETLWNGLMCGGELVSADAARSLVHLAEAVRESPMLRSLLVETRERPEPVRYIVDAWPQEPEVVRFREAFLEHVERYGFRCFEELKLECRTFRIEPRSLIPLLLHLADADVSVDDMQRRAHAIREQAEALMEEALRGRPLKGALLRFTLAQARRSIHHRDRARFDRARAFALARSVFRQLGAKLVEEGALDELEDVFLLTQPELFGYIRGASVDSDLRWVVSRRREQSAAHRRRRPAERMALRGGAYAGPAPQGRDVVGGREREAVLRGVPCAPGSVTAEALVVQQPALTEPVAGRVVVAARPDPGWVLWLPTLAGLVLEKGSLLSHTAILARELGVPTVVGVENAMERIQSGARIRVDGATGLVRLLPPATEA